MSVDRYLAGYDPTSYEWDTYARQLMLTEYLDGSPIRVIYQWDTPPSPIPRARLLYCDANDVWQPASGYIAVSGLLYIYQNVTVPDGHSAWSLELEGGTPIGTAILDYPFVRNRSGAPLADQRPFTALRRLEIEKHRTGMDGKATWPVPHAVRITPPAPGTPPYVGRVKMRAEVVGKNPDSRLAESQLWCSTLWAPDANWAMRLLFVKGGKGDTLVAREQKYPYTAAVSYGGGSYKSGLMPPTVHAGDGVRTQHTQDYISQIMIRDNLSGFVVLSTGSRCAFTQFPGVDITGLGVTDLRGFHPGQGNTDTIWGWNWNATTQAFEYIGDFRYVPGVTRVQEPWQFSMCRLMPDGTLNTRSGFTMWVGDPLTGDFFAVDIYPRHPQLPRPIPTTFMPAGYVRPADATQPVFVRLTTNPPGTWGNVFRVSDQMLYYTNMDAQTITRVHHSGSGKEVILTGKKTLAELGYSTAADKRLHPSSKTVAELRSYIVDGPLASASCIRPQFMAHDDHGYPGTILFVESGTLCVRRLDPDAGTVRTFPPIPEKDMAGTTPATWTNPATGQVVNTVLQLGGSSSSATQDMTIWVDDGSIGARGDVHGAAWGTTHTWDKDGNYLGAEGPEDVRYLRNGRADLCPRPTYSWGGDIHRSYKLRAGNDGYSQFKLFTPLLATDYVPDAATQMAIRRGAVVWNRLFLLTHGPDYGTLGYPNIEEMGSWTDQAISAYALAWGGTAGEVPDLITYVRDRTKEIDYTPVGTLPSKPTAPLVVVNITRG